ncbi:MAG: HPF/RaiA family ribosome-associated protein [Acidimicrobiales bacterium]|jgi:ribosomal subunit interface protein
MEITVLTRHLELPAGLRETAVEKARHLERFLEGTQRADIIFSRDHAARDDGHVTCEISVVAHGRVVRVRSSGHLANLALESALAKETQRLTRMQDRLVQRSRPRHGVTGQRATEPAD